MEPISQLVASALTGIQERQTKDAPNNIEEWSKWLDLTRFDDQQIDALIDACATFVKRMKQSRAPSWLTLLGRSGVGKTHAAEKVWDWAQKRFDWSKKEFIHHKIYWPEFVADLRSGNSYERFAEMREWPVLFLDDIGAERDTTGFASEQLNLILGCRVGKWTIITSNLFLNQLAAIDGRISDRIMREQGNIMLELNTTSYAMRKL